MGRAPEHPREIVKDLVGDYRKAYGDAVVSVIMYGSAASGDYVPGASDINLMIVLSEDGIEALDRAVPVVSKWRKRNVATPLLLTEAYIHTSLDVFPLEYLNFRNSYEVVYGKDVLAELKFDAKLLRLQCEREVKGKLLLLREGFLEADGKDRHIRELLCDSLHAFVAIFKGLLYIKEQDLPAKDRIVISRLCETVGLDVGAFEAIVDIKEKRIKPAGAELEKLFKSYLKEIRKLWQIVDDLYAK